MKRLLLLIYEWTLRIFFLFVILLTFAVFTLSFVDFAEVERHIFFLNFIKAEPQKISENVWIGPYLNEEELLNFIEKNRIEIVISLLDVDMLHERRLVEKEKELLKKNPEILFFSVPIKPFFEQKERIKMLKEILEIHKGKRIYIHSYLGRVRTEYVRRKIYDRNGN